MKKFLSAVVVVALSVPALAWSSNYSGNITSVIPAINGKTATMTTKTEGNKTIATVNFAGSTEEWVWDGKTLIQKELANGKVASQYGATAKTEFKGTEQTYYVNCKDATKNECDGAGDSRFSWKIVTEPNNQNPTTIRYLVYGPDKLKDPNARVDKRHEFVFTKTK